MCKKRGGCKLKADKLCEKAAEKYHHAIYMYCLGLLNGDVSAAEDCTQEVFLLLLEKKDSLDFNVNIRGWLYACANRIVKDYRKRERYRQSFISDVELFDIELVDPASPIDSDSIFDILTPEERKLLEAYYSADYGNRTQIANEFGLTASQLYKRICSIRSKLAEHIKNN